jgi:hypothetical protein
MQARRIRVLSLPQAKVIYSIYLLPAHNLRSLHQSRISLQFLSLQTILDQQTTPLLN